MKIKVRKKDCWIFIKFRIREKFDINRYEDNLLKCSNVLEFYQYKWGIVQLKGPTGISLKEKMNAKLTDDEFFCIVEQIVHILKTIEENHCSIENILLDVNYTFYNTSTKEIFFIYLPVKNNQCQLRKYLEEIIYSAIIDPESKYFSNFCFFLKKMKVIDLDKIERFIFDYKQQSNQKIISKNFKKNVDLLDEKTVAISKLEMNLDDEKTMLLNDEKIKSFYKKQEKPSLKRISTNEVININKNIFRLGKDEKCVDFVIKNNPTISRSHVDIIIKDDEYYVRDLHSKNKTYINNQVLPIEYEVQIHNGDILKLSDEEFLFQL